MDPWLEDPARWPDFHLSFIAAMKEVLAAKLRPRYVVVADERVHLEDPDGDFRSDLAIERAGTKKNASPPGRAAVPVIVPTVTEVVWRERFLTIRAAGSLAEIVTVIEVLSPTNKRSRGSPDSLAYVAKRNEVLAGTAHLVEIDLLRAGKRVPMKGPLPPASYYVIIAHSERRPNCEVYPIPLREPLPTVPIPLKGDETIELDLTALLELVYDRAGYDLQIDYARDPVPPLESEDVAWARSCVERRRTGP